MEPYRHSNDKVGPSLLEATYSRHKERSEIGDQCLYNEDDWDDSKLRELVSRQLRSELCEDCEFY